MSTSSSSKEGASTSNDGECEMNNMLQNMSTVNDADNNVSVCANCGKKGDNLKSCTACKMVKYCNRECQIAHRPQHKKECRKRAAELHDIELFKQPPSQHGDCPICFLQLPYLDPTGKKYMTCCGKMICSGCIYAPLYDSQGNEVDNKKCAFCRTSTPTTVKEVIKRMMKRVEADDPIATYDLGNNYRDGEDGYPQDHAKALELWLKAAKLGSTDACVSIGFAYNYGRGIDIDKEKAKHYYELAAMRGNANARHNLGNKEANTGNYNRAVNHYMIAARSGNGDSLNNIKEMYLQGDVTKEDYTKALQLYQVYLGEIKSPQRDKAAAYSENYRYH